MATIKNYKILAQSNTIRGPIIRGITKARKELAGVVAYEKKLARQRGYTPKCHWDAERMDCTITLEHSQLWDRFVISEVK